MVLHARNALALAAGVLASAAASAAPTVTRLIPPSELFSTGNTDPIIARFLPGQRFDLQATISPDSGSPLLVPGSIQFLVDGSPVAGTVTTKSPAGGTYPTGTTIGTLRAYSNGIPGRHTLSVTAQQADGQTVTATGNFEIVPIVQQGRRAKNIIVCIGDGMGIAHRTAARIMKQGVAQGKAKGLLAMDRMPYTGIVITHSLNSIVTDSAPGACCYSTGNKFVNNQLGVFPDDTTGGSNANNDFDNPRVELVTEYLYRTFGKTSGIVTTADVFDATPAAFASHTAKRGDGTGICDAYLDESGSTGLSVILGGGRKWFLPSGTLGSARGASTDYVLPAELASAWGVPAGAIDPARNLLGDFQSSGWTYAADRTALNSIPSNTSKLLGLFTYSNMNVALDKINGRRGTSTVVNDYTFPNQPMLSEMTTAAINVLNRNPAGFFLMVEGASIDKQAHNMDSERWILDTIEFDDAVAVCNQFAQANPDTLVIVTADHECAGINIIGASTVTDAALQARIALGQGAAQVRNGVVGTYDAAGFPNYTIAADGYPTTTDIDRRMLIGYAANADRYEDWRTNPLPLQDSQQPLVGSAPLNTYPALPINRDTAGNFLVTGQIADTIAAHTASDIPCSAFGRGSPQFTGVMDNTDIYFKMMQAALGGWAGR